MRQIPMSRLRNRRNPRCRHFFEQGINMPIRSLSIVTCRRCHYTQSYVADGSKFDNIFELLTQ